jgi:hypothetical protein
VISLVLAIVDQENRHEVVDVLKICQDGALGLWGRLALRRRVWLRGRRCRCWGGSDCLALSFLEFFFEVGVLGKKNVRMLFNSSVDTLPYETNEFDGIGVKPSKKCLQNDGHKFALVVVEEDEKIREALLSDGTWLSTKPVREEKFQF